MTKKATAAHNSEKETHAEPGKDREHSWMPSFVSGKKDTEPSVTMKGEAVVAAVKKLAADLAEPAKKEKFMVGEPTHFGLELEVFDPESGIIVVAARPRRRDEWKARTAQLDEGEIMLTVEQVCKEIEAARSA